MRRIFIAINLPESVRQDIIGLQGKLKKFDWPVRWTTPENIHVTLRFLGAINDEQLESVRKIIEAAVASVQPFLIKVNGFRILPDVRSPHIISLHVEDSRQLFDLQKDMARAVDRQGIGESEHHPFTSHLTIGRINAERVDLSALEQLDFKAEFVVKSVEVMESALKPAGPIYSIIQSFSLNKL